MKLLLMLAISVPLAAGIFDPPKVRFVATNPSGACGPSYITQNTVTGLLRGCFGGTWGDISTIGGITTTAGATFGAFTYDFTASTVSLPSIFLRSDTGWTMTNGQKITPGLSATTAGLRLTAGTLPSAQVAGDFFMNASGIPGFADGTNANAFVAHAGSGAAFSTAPTAGKCVEWAAGYKIVVSASNAACGGSTANYYTSTTGTGIGPTSFTPNVADTLVVYDNTSTTGKTLMTVRLGTGQALSDPLLNFAQKTGAGLNVANYGFTYGPQTFDIELHVRNTQIDENGDYSILGFAGGSGNLCPGGLCFGSAGIKWSGSNGYSAKNVGISYSSSGVAEINKGVDGACAAAAADCRDLALRKVVNYNGQATVSNGVSSVLATKDLTAQSAAIAGGTALYTPAATGMFRVSYYAKVTTAGTTSILGGTTGLALAYTDGSDSVAQTAFTLPEDNQAGSALAVGTGNTTNTTQAVLHGTAVIYALTGVPITYSFGYTSTGTAMVYELHIKLEAL